MITSSGRGSVSTRAPRLPRIKVDESGTYRVFFEVGEHRLLVVATTTGAGRAFVRNDQGKWTALIEAQMNAMSIELLTTTAMAALMEQTWTP